MTEETNPNVDKLIRVPPALLEAVAEDPAAAQPVFRAKAVLMAHELFMRRDTMSTVQQIGLMENFAKLGNLTPKVALADGNSGAGFSINIVLPGHEGKSKSIVIEPTIETDVIEMEVEASDE